MTPAAEYLAVWTGGCAIGVAAGACVLRARGALTPDTTIALGLAWLGVFVGSKWHARMETLPILQALVVTPEELFGPGRRLPLGLLTGGLAALGWSWLVRAPWRPVGDAFAVFASVLIPVGRVACLRAGCCMGTWCGPWLSPGCPRYGPGSEAFHHQVLAGLIPADAALSLPAHPLPVYFALASGGTLMVLVWLVRRGVPAGGLLVAFCILWPLAKLAIEPLRAVPRPPALMLGVPMVVLSAAVVVAGAWLFRRPAHRAVTALLLVVLASLSAPVAPASDDPERWDAALARYARDPLRNRRALRVLRQADERHLPAMALLALADARLRARRFHDAARLFARAEAAAPGHPYRDWAILGRGWATLLGGDVAAARRHHARAAEHASGGRPLAALMMALVDARAGRTGAAVPALDRLAESPETPLRVRDAARLGAAYARYWQGDAAEAERAFSRVAGHTSDGGLVDDAEYGAARAMLAAGDRARAMTALRALASRRRPGVGAPHASTALLNLDPGAVLRAAFARYRRAPLTPPARQVLLLFDGDGAALAAALLAKLEAATITGARAPESGSAPVAGASAQGPLVRLREGGVPERDTRGTSRNEPRHETLVLGALLLVALAALVAFRRKHSSEGRRGSR